MAIFSLISRGSQILAGSRQAILLFPQHWRELVVRRTGTEGAKQLHSCLTPDTCDGKERGIS